MPFVVSIEKRPEIRKVFPPKGGGTSAARGTTRGNAPRTAAPARGSAPSAPPRAGARRPPAAPRSLPGVVPAATSRAPLAYAIQIAALAQLDSARDIVIRLSASGLPAYMVEPGEGDTLYRVRVGPYSTRAQAEKVAADLEQLLGLKLWVMRDRQ